MTSESNPGPVPVPQSLDIARQIARGLEAAHEKAIVHRDVKPANAIVDDKGHVTVMDFGLALLIAGSKLTELDTTLGTAAYMSPEQTQGMEVDHRTDIWALGGVLYEMVCGKPPFRGLYAQALLYEIVHQEPEPLTAQRTGVPMELERIVGKCLSKDAHRRYSTAADLIVDLENLADGLKERSATVMRAASGSVATGSPAATGTRAGPDQSTTIPPPAALAPPTPGPDAPLTAEFVSTNDAAPAAQTTPPARTNPLAHIRRAAARPGGRRRAALHRSAAPAARPAVLLHAARPHYRGAAVRPVPRTADTSPTSRAPTICRCGFATSIRNRLVSSASPVSSKGLSGLPTAGPSASYQGTS